MKTKNKKLRVAIIGAGISGLTCARELSLAGFECTLFDKSERIGGRTSTRRANSWRFDHGSSYFSASNPNLLTALEALNSWEANGLAQPVYCGASGNSELAEYIYSQAAQTLTINLATTIESMEKKFSKAWLLRSLEGQTFTDFDLVICAMPAPQASKILSGIATSITVDLAARRTYCTWALMLVTENRLPLQDIMLRPSRYINRIVSEHNKPKRLERQAADKKKLNQVGQYVVQSSIAFGKSQLDSPPAGVIELLISNLTRLYGPLPPVLYCQAHRWLHSGTLNPLAVSYLWDRQVGLAAVGDWCSGNTVEDAFTNGFELAKTIIQHSG